MMTLRLGYRTVIAAFVLSAYSPAAWAAPVGVNRSDIEFMQKAAEQSALELNLTHLGQTRAQSPDVKKLAEQLHAEHMANNEKLHAIAHEASVPIADVSKAGKEMSDRLRGLQGSNFDKAFVDEVVKDHEKTVSFYQKQTKDGKSSEVKEYVEDTLPALKNHLQEAKELQSRLQTKG